MTVRTDFVSTETELEQLHNEFVEEGYEGAIIRTGHGLYQFGYRSHDLLKVKAFKDNEYKIVGYSNGVGKFIDCVIWVCETPEGKQFRVVPKGTAKERSEWLKEANKHIDSWLKVKYFEMLKVFYKKSLNHIMSRNFYTD